MTELKVNIEGFARVWESDGEPFAWEKLVYGEVGHDPPWHIVNDTSWKGPLEVPRKKGINAALCINERRGRPVMLSRGRRGKSVPPKNERCSVCASIILEAKEKLNGKIT